MIFNNTWVEEIWGRGKIQFFPLAGKKVYPGEGGIPIFPEKVGRAKVFLRKRGVHWEKKGAPPRATPFFFSP